MSPRPGEVQATSATASSPWDHRIAGGNAFDAVRLTLACLVVFEHAFVIVDGSTRREPLFVASHGQAHFGAVAVYMFFAISGFLVTRSFLETRLLTDYLLRRIGRIVPAFLVATAVACLVFGLFTTVDPVRFLHEQPWPKLLIQALTLHQIELTGILAGNPLTAALSTFWTIKYEFDCYLMAAVLGCLGLLRNRWAIFALAPIFLVLCVAEAGWIQFPNLDHGVAALAISNPIRWPQVTPFFIIGSAFYIYRRRIPKSPWLALLGGASVLAGVWAGGLYWALLIGGAYATFYVALSTSAEIRIFGRRTDLSYGVYLYGWPVAQLIRYGLGERLDWPLLLAIGLPCTLLTAYASWTLVERPALKLVHRATTPRQRPAAVLQPLGS